MRRERGLIPERGPDDSWLPIAIANQLNIPVYVCCDGDTDKTKDYEIPLHKRDNLLIQNLMGVKNAEALPEHAVISTNLTMWSTNLTDVCSNDFGACWEEHQEKARQRYGHAGGLNKYPLAVAYALESAWNDKEESTRLRELVDRIIEWASQEHSY